MLCLDNCTATCRVILCYVLHQRHSELSYWELCLFRYLQAYSSKLGIIKANSGLFRHVKHPVIHRVLAYLEPEAYSKHCSTLIRHSENPAIARTVCSGITHPYSGIFRTLCNVFMCRYLAHLKSWNIQNPFITASQRLLRTLYIYENW